MIQMLARFTSVYFAVSFFVTLFLAILFLQSGIDKVVDRRGNLEFHMAHFAQSPLARFVRPMFAVLTLMELSTGLLLAAGLVQLFLFDGRTLASYGALLASASITALFFGQRVAKDYAGAATLVPYFLLTLVAIGVLSAQGPI
jgi:diacylglycerol kinase